jgi:hypothetical protein
MDGDKKPDYKSEHEIIAQVLAGISTISGIICQATVASRRYDDELDDYTDSPEWIASFKLYNQCLSYINTEFPEPDTSSQQ